MEDSLIDKTYINVYTHKYELYSILALCLVLVLHWFLDYSEGNFMN